MLARFITLLRHILASRTIDAIAGELEKKVDKLLKAEADIIAHVDVKNALVAEARAALDALLAKTNVETKVLAEKVEKSQKVRAKLSIIG
jgi:translation initiation factor IF-2